MNSTAESKPDRNPMIFILVTILIDAIGFGLIIPVMPALLNELLGQGSSESAPWGGYLAFSYAAMHFLFGPAIGSLSDRFGRRPVLLISLAALVVDYIIMGYATTIEILFSAEFFRASVGRLTQQLTRSSPTSPARKKELNRLGW